MRAQRFAPWYLRYSVAIAIPAICLILTRAIAPMRATPFALFSLGVVIAALYGGLGASLIATLLSAFAINYFFLSIPYEFSFTFDDVVRVVVFAIAAIVVSMLVRRVRTASIALEERDASYRTTLASIGDAVIATDAHGSVSFMNRVAQQLTGWTVPDVLGRPMAEVFVINNEETGDKVEDPVEKVLKCGKIVGLANHTVLTARDGRKMPIDDSAAPIHGEDGKLLGVVLVFRDITARRQAEREREQALLAERAARAVAAANERELTSLLASIKEGFAAIDREWRYSYVNEQAAELVARPVTELVGRNLWETFPESVGTEFESAQIRAMEERVPTRVEVYYSALNKWFEIRTYPAAEGISMFLNDIGERKRHEEELRAQQQALATAQQAAGFGTWDWNVRTNQLRWSKEIPYLHGIKAEDFDGTVEGWLRTVHPEDLERVKLSLKSALERGGEYEIEFRTIWPDDTVHWTAGRGSVMVDGRRVPERMVGIAMDVTARHTAEEALRRAEKLAATGRLAATIAHEINNPLEAATNLLFIASTADGVSPIVKQALDAADMELRRVAHMAKQTLGFYRDTTSREMVRLSESLDELLTVYVGKIRAKNLVVDKNYVAEEPVFAFRGEIRQVFSNLIVNAVDACPTGGTLGLRIYLNLANQFSGADSVTVEIEDNGGGIPPEHLAHIFEPFFTTKKDVGTGLGLWIAHDLVHKNQGQIQVATSTEAGRSGTCFTVSFPVMAARQVGELGEAAA